MATLFVLLLLFTALSLCEAVQWWTALTSNVDDSTFYYNSRVWFNSTPFNTATSEVNNALFESYSTVYVERVRITLDGTTDSSCGSACVLTFVVPPSHYGKYTLMDLVTGDGGLELIDTRGYQWRDTAENYFKFEGSSYYDKYYCHNFGLNYANYEGSNERYRQRSRARIGVMMNYYTPVGDWRAAEGIGLTYGWSRQWTDNVGSGRVESYKSYLFRKAKVEVFGDTIPRTEDHTYSPIKIDGYSRYPVQYTYVNSTLQNTFIPKNTFTMMFRSKRTSSYLWDQVFSVGTSKRLNTLFVTPDSRDGSLFYDGRHFRHYTATTYSIWDSISPYHAGLTTGYWHQLAFTTDLNRKCVWVDGFPVYTWPFYRGTRLLSDAQESFQLARVHASLAAEISDFRFYYNELSGSELRSLRSNWMHTRKGCGDGERDLWEGCDDGNVISGDGCSNACEIETGFICKGGNSSSIQPDSCVAGYYATDIDFEEYGDKAGVDEIYSTPSKIWRFSVTEGWAGWDMTGTFLGTTLTNMSLGSANLATATCSQAEQKCCDDTFGKMIGGLRMCGGGCELESSFTDLPAHNYVRVTVQLAFIDYWDYRWVYMFADDEVRMRLYKYWHSYPVVNSEACLPTEGGGSNVCRVNYCGSTSYADDLTTMDVFFFHNKSTLDLKFTNTLNSATSKGLGFVYLDMEVGFSDEFVFQTEGAGYLNIGKEYGSHNKSKGISLRNYAFPSYAAKSGSSYSHLNIPQTKVIPSDSFIEYSFNYIKAPFAYGGFYLTLLRLDHEGTDMFEYNLQACTESATSCPGVMFYRICFDSSYEPPLYHSESSTYCDERILLNVGAWTRETAVFRDKFAFKYGVAESKRPGKFAAQFGVYGDYYGTVREVELLLDDIKIGSPSAGSSLSCPTLQAYASPTVVEFELNGLTGGINGTRTAGQWNVVLIDAATHATLSSIQYFSDADFVAYVDSLNYGSLVMLAHTGPDPCGGLSTCSDALGQLGGTSLISLPADSGGQTIAAIGLKGARLGKMPFSLTPLFDGGLSTAKSDIGCHSSRISIGENFHPFAPLMSGYAWNNRTSYYSDESSLGFMGCFIYGSESELFSHGYDNGYTMTPGACSLVCHDSGFVYGRVYYTQCYCGDKYGQAYTISDRSYPVSATGEVSNEYCWQVQRLKSLWNKACRGDYNQDCRYYTYDAWYRARSSEPLDISTVLVTCVNAQSNGECLNAADSNYGTYYRSKNIVSGTSYEITLDLLSSYSLDTIRIHTVSYYLLSFETLCGATDTLGNVVYTSFGVVTDANLENNNIYINAVNAHGWSCRFVKINLLSTTGSYFRIRDVRVNYFPSVSEKAKYDLYTTTYNRTYYDLSRSLNYRSNAYANNILPVGDMRSSFRVDPNTGALWSTQLVLDYEQLNSYHVRLLARVSQFNSGWFSMSDVTNFVEIPHYLGSFPWNVYVHVKCLRGENEGFVFSGSGVAMIDGSEIGNVTFGGKSIPELYGGLLFAYNDKTIRLWAPSGTSGYIINVNTGWAQSQLQSEKDASVRVRASVGTSPQYDSGWVRMRSQSHDSSKVQRDFYHDLGSLEYAVVKVYYRAVGGANDGYVFEAVGSSQADDDGGSYGGVVFGYSDTFVRVFLPNNTDVSKDNCQNGFNGYSLVTGQNECRSCTTLGGYPCTHKDGYAIYVPPGFGGGTYTQKTHDVDIRVRIWTYKYNKAAFVSEGVDVTSNGVAFKEINHYAGDNVDSVYVVSRALALDFPMYFRAMSASTGTDIRPRAYGGVLFAFDSQVVRLWAPAVSQNDMWHAYGQAIQVGDGWGNGTTSVGSQGASVKAMFFMANEPAGIDTVDTVMFDIKIDDNNEIPYLKTDDTTIVEDTFQAGYKVTSIYAYDVDGSALSTFTIISGNKDDAFVMDNHGNVLINNAAAIDYEKHMNFTLEIAVSDGVLSEVGVLFIMVLDRNDIPILWPPYDREVREGSAATTAVGEPLNATDTDISQSTLFYMLDEGNYNDAFGISSCAGQIFVKNPDALDYESITGYNFFNLTVMITDDGQNPGNTTYIIPVTVLNRNDPPEWTTNIVLNVTENSPIGTLLDPNLNELCSDPDYGDLLTYEILSISSSSAGSIADDPTINGDGSGGDVVVQVTDFVVNNATGNLTVGTEYLNYETNAEYSLYIRCRDYNLIEPQDPPNLYDDEYIKVHILDANDAPVFSQQSLVQYLYENSPQETYVTNTPVIATDEDVDDTITYSIVQNYNNLLEIDSLTGELYQASAVGVNYEQVQFFQIVVAATDHGLLVGNITVEPLSTTAIINISVGDVNEAPTFMSSSVTMNETTSSSDFGKVVASVSGSDPDILSNQALTFTITGSYPPSAAASFSLISTGKLTADVVVTNTISYEQIANLTLYMDVMDNGGNPSDSTVAGLKDSGVLPITVRDINDAPVTDCSLNSTSCVFTIAENSQNGAYVGSALSSDEDGDALTWSLVNPSVSFGKRFSLDQSTGVLTVLLQGDSKIDYESTDVYSFTVKISDASTKYPGPRSMQSIYTVQVMDVAEPPYYKGAANLEFGASEDISPNATIGAALANYFGDQDAGTILSYSIASTMVVYPDNGGASRVDPTIFFINSVTGQIYIGTSPSSIPYAVDYVLKFNATVTDGTFNVWTEVTVAVLDNNAPPTFADTNCTVVENTVGPYDVCTLYASDPDGDAIAFALSSSDSDYFSVSTAGVLSLRSGVKLNFEDIDKFNIVVVAADNVKYPQTTSAKVSVFVLDQNDYPVVNARSFSIPENRQFGSMIDITSMTFTDEDRDPLLCSATSSFFIVHEVNSGNFNLSVNAVLNSGESDVTNVNVATDSTMEYVYVTLTFDPMASSTASASSMQLVITDASGRSVSFVSWPSSWSSTLSGVYTAVVNTLSSGINGSGTWTVEMVNSGGSGPVDYNVDLQVTFEGRDILDTSDSTSCYLGLYSPLDYETLSVIKFRTKVFDGEVFLYSNTTVNVVDINEPPVVSDAVVYIDENSVAGTMSTFSDSSLAYITVADQEDNAISFSIVSGNEDGFFELQTVNSQSPATFAVIVAQGANIDYESRTQYDLVVKAMESGTPENYYDTAQITVVVKNVNDVSVTDVVNTKMDALGRPNAPFDTDGGDTVVITGTNFGFKNVVENVLVSYGPSGIEYTALSCVVSSGNNVEITCTTAPGVGMEHVWRVEVLSSGHAFTTTYASRITTNYYRPTLFNMTNANLPGESFRTVGGETLRVSGNQMGTSTLNNTFRHFAGFTKLVKFGTQFYLEDVFETGLHKCRSALAIYLADVNDQISLISDDCPSAGKVVVTVKSKYATDKSSFSPSNIAANPCYFERTGDEDWHGLDKAGRLTDFESVHDEVFLPAAMAIVTTSSATLVKACSSETVWRTYVDGNPRLYYASFDIASSAGVDDVSGNGSTAVVALSGGFSLLSRSCHFNGSDSVDCLTQEGVGKNYRVRYFVAGQISDEIIDPSLAINYHSPVILTLTGTDSTLLLDTRGYTVSTPYIIYIRTIFGGSDSAFTGYGGGLVSYGLLNATGAYSTGYYGASCVVSKSTASSDMNGYLYCRDSGVCRYEQVDLFTCKPVAGTGAQHSWRVTVGEQQSEFALTTTSYKPPSIAYMNPDLWPFSDTAGGDSIIIVGNQFGPVGSSAIYGAIDAFYGSTEQFEADELFGTVASSCSVTSAHEVVTCTVGAGTGKNHSWIVTVAGQTSNRYHAASSYSPPILVDFAVYNSSDYQSSQGVPDDVQSYATEGQQFVEIIGRNFGPIFNDVGYNAPIKAIAAFVGDQENPYLWEYGNCTVIKAHLRMVCETSPGVGSELKWAINIDNQTNTVPSTSYSAPSLTRVVGVGFNISDGINTRGGQYIELIGENFGPDISFVERISFGPTGGEYVLFDPVSRKYNCIFLVPHREFRCLTPEGFGQNHFFTVRVAGQKTDSTADTLTTVSYKRPTITSVTPIEGTTRGGYSIRVAGSNFGPLAGAVFSFAGKTYDSYPLTYLSHEAIDFVVPEGQGEAVVMSMGHRASWCAGDCEQYSSSLNFEYIRPQLDRLIFSDSTVSGYSNLTLYGPTSTSNKNLDGGSFGGTPSMTYTDDAGTEYDFINNVFIFPYNVSASYVDNELTRLYEAFVTSTVTSVDDIEGFAVRSCLISTDLGNEWSHDLINCLVLGSNGTVVVSTYDMSRATFQRSDLFLFREKSPVVYYPVGITSSFPADNKYPTTGGFTLTISGLYFGSFTQIGSSADGVDILLYLEDYMDDVKCQNLVVVTPTNDDQETTLSCTVPPGQGKNVAIIVRKGGDQSRLISDYIVGDSCRSCFAYDPPMIGGFGVSTIPTTRRALDTLNFPVYSVTTGITQLTFYGSNFGLPGGAVVQVAGTVLMESGPHDHTNLTVALTEGVGMNHQISITVANHQPVTYTVDSSSDFLVHYYPPDITAASKMMLHTAGNELVIITGTNFGRSENSSVSSVLSTQTITAVESDHIERPTSELHSFLQLSSGNDQLPSLSDDISTAAEPRRLGTDDVDEVALVSINSTKLYTGRVELAGQAQPLSEWNHTTVVVRTTEAAGGVGKSITVYAGDQTDVLSGFAYYPPQITAISLDHGPTSGLTVTGQHIPVTLFGTDFGSTSASRYVTFGDTTISGSALNSTHFTLEFYVPSGQGVNVAITVTVEGQTSNAVYFTYDPPLADNLTPNVGDTDACNQWESLQAYITRLDTNPNAQRLCTDKQYLTLSGYSFGTTGMKIVVADTLVCETDSTGKVISSWNCLDCAQDAATGTNKCYQSHREIVFWAPQSYGSNLTVALYVDNRRDNESRPLFYSYYPPQITVSSPGSNSQGYGYIDARGDSITIQGENLGGMASWVSINFTGIDKRGQLSQLPCASAMWNPGSFSVGNGFPYLTCTMPNDIVGAKNMTIHVADQTVYVPVRRIVDNSLFISTCKASYDSSNQQTLYYGLRYYMEKCVECPVGALCKPEEYEVDPVSDEAFWLTYYDVNSVDGKDLCDTMRRPPHSTRTECPVFEGCFPTEACTGANTCDEAYSYVLSDCIEERSRNGLKKYNNNTCYEDHDCNKGSDICAWDKPQQCAICNRVPGSTGPGYCQCTAAPKCSLCKIREYYRIGGKCVKCPQNVMVLIVLFVTAMLGFVVGGYYLNKYKFNLAFVAIGFDYFQVLAVFASSDIVWPPLIIKMFTISLFFSFDINITAPECAFPDISYESKWFATMFLPIAGGMALFIMFLLKLIHKFIWRHKRGWTALTKHGNQLMAMFVIMLYYLYLPLLRKALEIVNCNPADPEDGHLYTEWTSINCAGGVCRCWENWSDPQMQLLPFSLASLVLYAIGYPLYVTYIITQNKELIKEDQLLRAMNTGDTRATNPMAYDIRKKFHKLYYHFKPGKVYWMILVLIRKFWIAVAALVFRSNPTFQMSFILLVMFVCYILQVKHRPFMSTVEREGELERHRAKVEEAHQAQEKGERLDDTMMKHLKIERIIENVQKKDEVQQKRIQGHRSSTAGNVATTSEDIKEFFWDFNNVELYLLGCAIFVCISGIMFESDSYSSSNALHYQLMFLTFLVILVIASSLLYFIVVFMSEILTTFGYDTTGMFEFFMSKEYKKKTGKEESVAEMELRHMDSGDNPMVAAMSDEAKTKQTMEMAKLADENEMLMKQVAGMKKKEQLQRMSSFGTIATTGVQTQKKLKKKKSTFESQSSVGSSQGGSFHFDDERGDML